MTTTPAADSVWASVDAACDYLAAALTGAPLFASTVAEAHGSHRVARGLSVLLLFLINDAAEETDTHPTAIVETIRDKYAPRENHDAE